MDFFNFFSIDPFTVDSPRSCTQGFRSNPVIDSMKKIIIIGSVCAIVLASAGLCAEVHFFRQNAISAVLKEQERDARTLEEYKGLSVSKAYKVYVSEINRIDYSLCPQDFQAAWLNYLQTCNRPGPYSQDWRKLDECENVALKYGLTFTFH